VNGSAGFRLETERLILRDWHDADWEPFFRHTNTPVVMLWLGGELDEVGRTAQRTRVENCCANNGFCFWLVERKPDGGHLSGEPLGMCGLKRADAPGSTVEGEFEIGWRLRKGAWGYGFAKEAAIASLEAAFEQFGAEEIYALTVEENAASWGLMKRLGMRRRFDLDYIDDRFDAPFRDTIVYSISREEWENARNAA
jgi:RimJ/RimL family protein N-acetyltransferase